MNEDLNADLSGRICLITGGNRGIGLATGTLLAEAGAEVVLACRDPTRGAAAVRQIGAKRADYLLVDLSSQRSIRALAERFRERYSRLDVLVNNAATVSEHRQTTVDGREVTFAVNHLAYFLLTRQLLDLVQAADDGVVINVAATNHRDIVEGAEDVDSLDGYEMKTAYKRSKLANVSFTLELARRLGSSARVNSFCPGVVATELLMQFRRVPEPERPARLAAEDDPMTAAQIAFGLVTSPGTGRYLEEGVDVDPSPLALDTALAQRLWDRCADLTARPSG